MRNSAGSPIFWPLLGIRLRRLLAASVASILPLSLATSGAADGRPLADHVVVMVWDGLRPDSVTEQDTPVLFRLSKEGTFFANNHCVYISSTEVNGTAISTGGYPNSTGIMANAEFRPDVDPLKPFGTEALKAVRQADDVLHGRYIGLPTMAEIVQGTGRRTVVAGSKPVALLADRRPRNDMPGFSPVLFHGETLPDSLAGQLTSGLGSIPKTADPTRAANRAVDAWTTDAVTKNLWAAGIPALSIVWMSEPDYAQHGSAPNSAVAKHALKSSDDNLGRLLKALDDAKARESTAIFIVSDHGFSTISRAIDTAGLLNDAGFHAFKSYSAPPAIGDVMVVPNGGSVSLYVAGRDKRTVQRLVEFLQASEFAGVIFSRFDIEGTFPLAAAKIDTASAPDIVFSFRWTADESASGMRGMIISDSNRRAGQGMHATLSRFDMHNTLIAAGPGIRRGFTDELPSGNADVAPTVLKLLGISVPGEMDGRPLEEALVGGEHFAANPISEMLESKHRGEHSAWRQYLKRTQLGRQTYLDEGNGEATSVDPVK